MRLSLKNILISFVLSLLIFSLAMTVLGIVVYRDSIPVSKNGDPDSTIPYLPMRRATYELSTSSLYYHYDEEGRLKAAVLCGKPADGKSLLLVPIEPQIAMEYGKEIYFISSICKGENAEALSEVVEAVTGITPKQLVRVENENTVEALLEMVRDKNSGCSEVLVPLITDDSGVLDKQKTIEQFFTEETK